MDRLDLLHEMAGTPVSQIRTFETGATRNANDDKFGYEGFLSPIVLKRFAEYMHLHRKQADGQLRAPDNWQKGIPKEAYMDSKTRHDMDLWLHHRGFSYEATEDLETALCAIMFNTMGYLFEVLKTSRRVVREDHSFRGNG